MWTEQAPRQKTNLFHKQNNRTEATTQKLYLWQQGPYKTKKIRKPKESRRKKTAIHGKTTKTKCHHHH